MGEQIVANVVLNIPRRVEDEKTGIGPGDSLKDSRGSNHQSVERDLPQRPPLLQNSYTLANPPRDEHDERGGP